jgi:hypothetical protein
MLNQLEHRLQVLRSEYSMGQTLVANLESQQTHLKETLLRISGAIQVLEEELTLANSEIVTNENHQSKTSSAELIAV